jgi:hypothetical protein
VPLAVYAITRLVLYLAALYAAKATASGGLHGIFTGWDASHYLGIITQGYPRHPNPAHYSNIAFLPGYPVVVRVIKDVFQLTPLGAALFVSIGLGAVFIVLVTRLVASIYGRDAGWRAGVLLAVFPGSFILSLPYAEALALVLVVSCFWFTSREWPILGGICGALATFTSSMVIPLAPALLWRAWRHRDLRAAIAAMITPIGFLVYMGYLWQHTGHPFIWFQEVSQAFDHHFRLLATFDVLHYWPSLGLIDTAGIIMSIVGLVALWRIRAPIEWTAYALILVASVFFDSALWLTPRILLNAFPLVIGLAIWLRRGAFYTVVCLFATLLPVVFLFYMSLGIVSAQP